MLLEEKDFYKDSASQGIWFYKCGADFTKETMLELIQAQKILQELVNEEYNTGRALVDVQNWLSKEGKHETELLNHYLTMILKKHGVKLRL